jgi:hypothetical protein
VFHSFIFQISDDDMSTEARSGEPMAPWIYDKKFLMDMWFLFRTLPFMTVEDDDLKHPTQEQEEWHTTTIGFEFHRGLKNSVTTFWAVVSQPATTNSIDSPAWLPTWTPSATTRYYRLALGEIWTTKTEESMWSSVAIGKRSIPLASTQRSIGLRRGWTRTSTQSNHRTELAG